jgi:hypothetical protein
MDIYNQDKVMQQAKEIWEQAYKPFMRWDEYWYQVNEQIKVYLSLPEKDKPLMMKSLKYRASRTHREVVKAIGQRKSK